MIVAALVLLAAWLGAVTVILRRYVRVRQRLLRDASIDQLEALLAEVLERGDRMGARQRESERFQGAATRLLETSLVAPQLVRYDAYDNIAGSQSFSFALLDRRHTGLILTSLVGRDGGRLYVKLIHEGVSSVPLSDEETTALQRAREDSPAATDSPPGT